jgi:hypothetical protein
VRGVYAELSGVGGKKRKEEERGRKKKITQRRRVRGATRRVEARGMVRGESTEKSNPTHMREPALNLSLAI